jgi:hypothetical protein
MISTTRTACHTDPLPRSLRIPLPHLYRTAGETSDFNSDDPLVLQEWPKQSTPATVRMVCLRQARFPAAQAYMIEMGKHAASMAPDVKPAEQTS